MPYEIVRFYQLGSLQTPSVRYCFSRVIRALRNTATVTSQQLEKFSSAVKGGSKAMTKSQPREIRAGRKLRAGGQRYERQRRSC
jgi:hypothetical protein